MTKKYGYIDQNKTIAKNSLFSFSARALDIAMKIILVAIIARYLGVKLFGEYAFVMAVGALFIPFLDFGIERIIVREISCYKPYAEKYVGSAIILRIMFSAILILLVIAITHFFKWNQRTVQGIYIVTFTQIFVSFGMVFLGVFRAFERMDYDILLSFIHQLIRFTCIIVVVLSDLGFLSIFLAIAIADLSKTVLQAMIVSMKFLKIHMIINLNNCKLLLKESYPLAIFAMILLLSFNIDIFVLKYFHGPAEISLFDIPHKIIIQFHIVAMSVTIALFPLLSRLAKSSRTSLETVYEKAFKIFLNLSIPFAVIMLIWSKEIILVLFGNQYVDASLALQFLSGTIPCLFLITLMNFTLTSIGKQKMITISGAICFSVKFLLDIILVPKYGYIGASIGTFAAYFSFVCADYYFTSRYLCKIPVISLASRAVICGVIMSLGCLIFINGDLSGHILGFAGGILCYAFTMILLKTFTTEEINMWKMIILN